MRMYLLETTDALRVDAPAPQRLWLGARVGGAGVHRRRPEDDRVCPVGSRPGVHTRRLPPPVCTRPPSQLRGRMVRRACGRPAFATRSTCCARPQRIAKHTPERTPRAILCVVRRTATPDVAQHAPSLYVVSGVERAGRPGPARRGSRTTSVRWTRTRSAPTPTRSSACAASGAPGWAYCPPSGASLRDADGKARQRSIPTLRECRRPGAARLAVRLWPCD